MKTFEDFVVLMDKYDQAGKLPNGKQITRRNVAEYFTYHEDKYIGRDGLRAVGEGGFGKWYGHWFRDRGRSVPVERFGDSPEKPIQPVTAPIPPEEEIAADRRLRVVLSQRDEYKKKYGLLLNQIEEVESRFDTLCAIKEPIEFEPIVPQYKDSVGEAIAIAQLSDIHVGEKVDPTTINGYNEYDPDIADERMYKYFQNLLRITTSARHDSKIETLFFSLTGDMITGYIHEEFVENNYMSPTEEIRFAKRLLIRGFDFLLNHGKFKKIIIQTNFGNHGRNTKKTMHSTGYKNSYEQMMYYDLADYYKSEKMIEWNITRSHIAYSPKMFGKIIRTFHGDTVKYGGGIGGLTVPLIKYIHRLDQQQHADMSMLGHFHTMIPGNRFMVNGSGIGFNAYAQSLGCEPEPPQHNFRILDKHRGFVGHHPIFMD